MHFIDAIYLIKRESYIQNHGHSDYCYHVELTKFSQKQSNSPDVKILLAINKEGRLFLTGRQLLY